VSTIIHPSLIHHSFTATDVVAAIDWLAAQGKQQQTKPKLAAIWWHTAKDIPGKPAAIEWLAAKRHTHKTCLNWMNRRKKIYRKKIYRKKPTEIDWLDATRCGKNPL
jgi:hypothetical protein